MSLLCVTQGFILVALFLSVMFSRGDCVPAGTAGDSLDGWTAECQKYIAEL